MPTMIDKSLVLKTLRTALGKDTNWNPYSDIVQAFEVASRFSMALDFDTDNLGPGVTRMPYTYTITSQFSKVEGFMYHLEHNYAQRSELVVSLILEAAYRDIATLQEVE